MATNIVMPRAGDSMEEGRIVQWMKKEGDPVEDGEVILEVETDKTVIEVESFSRGVLSRIVAREGETVPVGGILAVIAEEGAEINLAPGPRPRTAGDRIKASPLARRIAEDHGIDLSTIKATGSDGRIRKEDVIGALDSVPASLQNAQSEDQVVELSSMRRAIARSLQASKQISPHFYASVDVDMTECLNRRARWNRTREVRASINDVILKATGEALRAVPRINAIWDGDKLIQKGAVNIGIAIPVEDGLVVSVLRDVPGKNLSAVVQASRGLISKAKHGKVTGDGTFTVSNMGMWGIKHFAAIINPPECAILAVGAVEKRPVVGTGGALAVRSMVTLTLSCDHRAIDGALASEFLNQLKSALQTPRFL